MKVIPLNRGFVAFVDDEDYVWLMQWKWRVVKTNKYGRWYAVRSQALPTKKTYYMHRGILGLRHGDPRLGDHIESSQTLNNQSYNLRIANHVQNSRNIRLKKSSTLGLKGIYKAPRIGPQQFAYGARIRVDGKRICLGYRNTPEEAYELYCEAAKKYHGEYARVA